MSVEMTDNKLRWVIAGFAFFVGVSYFIWLCMIYARFMATDQFVRIQVAEHYAEKTVYEQPAEKECEDCPDASEPPGV